MKYFASIISFLFHPIWFPIYGTILFLLATEAFLHIEMEKLKETWIVLVVVSAVVPALAYIILYMLNWLKSPFQIAVDKRKWLFYGYISILLVIALKITTIESFPVLYFYMMNLAIGCFIIVFLSFFRIFGSLSVMLSGGIAGFSVFLSIFFHIDLVYVIVSLIFAGGLVASSRMYLTKQTLSATFFSWVVGFFPQVGLLWFLR